MTRPFKSPVWSLKGTLVRSLGSASQQQHRGYQQRTRCTLNCKTVPRAKDWFELSGVLGASVTTTSRLVATAEDFGVQ